MRGKLSIYTIILKHIQRADLLYYFQLVISPGERKVMDCRKKVVFIQTKPKSCGSVLLSKAPHTPPIQPPYNPIQPHSTPIQFSTVSVSTVSTLNVVTISNSLSKPQPTPYAKGSHFCLFIFRFLCTITRSAYRLIILFLNDL